MNIHEVVEYGPIVAHDEELDILITVNGAYFNLWVADYGYTPMRGQEYPKGYTNTEAYDMRSRVVGADNRSSDGLYGLEMVKVMDAAESLLAEILSEEEEDDDDE